MGISVRTRFEVFKRDEFTCLYCGRKSPEVVLEIDHIVPVSAGGTDDPINLTAACWDCNRGKAGVSLGQVMTGEDPHDRAILLLERERQLQEYNALLARIRQERERDTADLADYWHKQTGWYFTDRDVASVIGLLDKYAKEQIRYAIDEAARYRKVRGFGYVIAVLNNLGKKG